MEIRQLNYKDIDFYKNELCGLLNIVHEASNFHPLDSRFNMLKLEALKEYLDCKQAYMIGAFVDSEIKGFLWGYELKTPEGRIFHIAYFAVMPSMSKMGFGSKLINAAEEYARSIGISKVELIVDERNDNAISFYLHRSYKTRKLVLVKNI